MTDYYPAKQKDLTKKRFLVRVIFEDDEYDMLVAVMRKRNIKYANILFSVLLKEESERLKQTTAENS